MRFPERLGVGFRRDVLDLPVGHGGQFRKDVAQVGVGIDAPTTAVLDERVEYGSALVCEQFRRSMTRKAVPV